MINSFPVDFNIIGYDLKTTDELIWKIFDVDDHYEIRSGDLSYSLMKLDGRFTVFAPGYRNINLHGFDIGEIHYELSEVVQNENYVAPIEVPTVSELLYAKERAFAVKLFTYAQTYSIDLMSIEDINISSMLTAVFNAGATEEQVAAMSSILLALTRDIEAEAGQIWADCWAALKYRLPGYFQEIIASNNG